MMSATQTEPTVNWSLVDIRMESRFWLNWRWVELSTFMIACPASLTNAILLWNASTLFRKLEDVGGGQYISSLSMLLWSVRRAYVTSPLVRLSTE